MVGRLVSWWVSGWVEVWMESGGVGVVPSFFFVRVVYG